MSLSDVIHDMYDFVKVYDSLQIMEDYGIIDDAEKYKCELCGVIIGRFYNFHIPSLKTTNEEIGVAIAKGGENI